MNIDHGQLAHILTMIEHHARQARELICAGMHLEMVAGQTSPLTLALNGHANGTPNGGRLINPQEAKRAQAQHVMGMGKANLNDLVAHCAGLVSMVNAPESGEEVGGGD